MAVLGAVLLLAALFLPWYTLDTPDEFPGGDATPFDTFSATAWQAFTALDVLLAGLAVASVRSRTAALAAVAVVLFRTIDSPGPNTYLDLGPGPWLALAGALTAALRDAVRPWMGSVLLVVSLFLPWYGDAIYIITRGANDTETVSLINGSVREYTAWSVFAVLDVLLLVLALAAVRFWAAAALAAAVVVYRLIDTPTPIPDLRPSSGAWLALAGALITLVAHVGPRDTASP
jgi:hypothetical protein